MSRTFKPATPFNVPMKLLIPTTTIVKGTPTKTFPDPKDAPLFFGSFRTFGGTENLENDIYTVVATATIDTWYRPDIKANCRIYICDTDEIYEVVSNPENVYMRGQYLQIKVQKIGGAA